MNAKARLGICGGVALVLLLGSSLPAHAFFPAIVGGPNNDVRVIKWAMSSMNDANHDGDISGANEGIEYMVEGGTYGYTDDEIVTIREAFDVWQDVPTSYIGFQFQGTNEDPMEISPDIVDMINYIALDAPGDPFPSGATGDGVLGQTAIFYVTDETGGGGPIDLSEYGLPIQLYVTPFQIIEVDIVLNAAYHRPATPGQKPLFDLKATLVHEFGHIAGLMHTPLNNVAFMNVGGLDTLVESAAVSLRDSTGVLGQVGATPTMFPIYFLTDDGRGTLYGGCVDLAPDDIAGISYLYPRGSQDGFFTLSEEARTQARAGFPSFPNIGAHIVAWCDADNDEVTPRVPLVSTMTGLYEATEIMGGYFDLIGLPKVLETVGASAPFQATYTFTANPINDSGFERQAPPVGIDAAGYMQQLPDSVHPLAASVLPAAWPSETFHETGNVFGVENHEVGTPLVYDVDRANIISVDTNKGLATILPGRQPMFGDRNDVCPFNVVVASSFASGKTTSLLRGVRSAFLSTAVGTAIVDAYYQSAPSMARLLLRHPTVLRGVQMVFSAVEYVLDHYRGLLLALVLVAMAVRVRARRRAVAAGCLALALGLFSSSAQAAVMYLSDEQIVAMSDKIITGTVESATSQIVTVRNMKRVVTDVVVTVDDSLKGQVNKASSVYLRILGGKVGPLVLVATESPRLEAGQEVLLYLKYRPGVGDVIIAGQRGTVDVSTDKATGTKYVVSAEASVEPPEADAKAAPESPTAKAETQEPVTKVPLDDYKKYLRGIVEKQKKAK